MESFAWSVVNQNPRTDLWTGTADYRPDRDIVIHCKYFRNNIYTVTIEARNFETALQEVQRQVSDGLFRNDDVIAYPSGF